MLKHLRQFSIPVGQGDSKHLPGWRIYDRIALALLLVLLAGCAPGQSIFASGNWQLVGPAHQHIDTIAVDPNNSQNIYGGDAQDGIFKSTDGGLHWQHSSSGLPSSSAVNALAFDNSGKKLYAAIGTGLYVSLNAAQSWAPVSSAPADEYMSLAFDQNANSIIFAAALHHGVMYSSNSGQSWAAINAGLPPSVTINTLTFDSSQRQLWAATSQGIYLSGNNGTTWQAMNNGLTNGADINDVLPAAIYGGNVDLIYAGTSHGVYLSQDHGAHWTASRSALTQVNVSQVLIDTQNGSTIYIATDKLGVLSSTDNGQDWRSVAPGLPVSQPVHAIAQGAANYSQLFAATDDVYIFPGTSSVFDPSRLIPLLIAIIFFYLLYRLSTRARRRTRRQLKSGDTTEQDRPPQDEANAAPRQTDAGGNSS